jgi:tetratricopeptide (TPR) repeat protein
MNAERHYDDDALITLAVDPATTASDLHLRTCRPCANSVATLRDVTSAMKEEVVWSAPIKNSEPRMETVEFLRGRQLLALSAEKRRAFVEKYPAVRCAGVVSTLIAASDRVFTSNPPEALELGKLAAEIGGELGDPTLHASALREYGYSLYYTGQYVEALRVTDQAAALLENSSGAPAVDRARIDLQKALILSDMGQQIEACSKARQAKALFESHKDLERVVVAMRTEAIALNRMRKHAAALSVLNSAAEICSEPVARAGLLQNIAVTYRQLGRFDDAAKFFTNALELALDIGSAPFVTKARWLLGRLFLAQGKCKEALEVLHSVRESFVEMQMVQDVAVATIDIAEAMLMLGQPESVRALCSQSIRYFARMGLSNSESSLTALALIQEAASSNALTPAVLSVARNRAQDRRGYLFAAAD